MFSIEVGSNLCVKMHLLHASERSLFVANILQVRLNAAVAGKTCFKRRILSPLDCRASLMIASKPHLSCSLAPFCPCLFCWNTSELPSRRPLHPFKPAFTSSLAFLMLSICSEWQAMFNLKRKCSKKLLVPSLCHILNVCVHSFQARITQ